MAHHDNFAVLTDHAIAIGTLDRMRKLRLWHWQCAVYNRDLADNCWWPAERKAYSRLSDSHLSAVVWLNDFFPSYTDTAERDLAMSTQSMAQQMDLI